jgi:outer membrane receptor for ferric coprogen and ferric-rhodotorulic acid
MRVANSPEPFINNLRIRSPSKITPYGGVMYDVSRHYSLYVSYADINQSFGLLLRSDLTPVGAGHGVDIEAGLKGAWRDGGLNGLLVLYKINQYRFPVFDQTPRSNVGLPPFCCYRPADNRSKGVDVELSGELAPGHLIGAGYTYNINEAALGGELSRATPRHLLKLWTSQRLPAGLRRWTLGGSLHAQSRNRVDGAHCPQPGIIGVCTVPLARFEVAQEPYVVVDLRASFEIDPRWVVALSINNAFDRVYFETLGSRETGNWYGEPRNLLLRIDGRF